MVVVVTTVVRVVTLTINGSVSLPALFCAVTVAEFPYCSPAGIVISPLEVYCAPVIPDILQVTDEPDERDA